MSVIRLGRCTVYDIIIHHLFCELGRVIITLRNKKYVLLSDTKNGVQGLNFRASTEAAKVRS